MEISKDEIVEVELYGYNRETHDYEAKFGDRLITVDPYTGCVWNDHEIKFGKKIFIGFWYSQDKNIFLVLDEIK